jgi:hypothetical protein
LLNDSEKLKALLDNIPLKRLGKTTDMAGWWRSWRQQMPITSQERQSLSTAV